MVEAAATSTISTVSRSRRGGSLDVQSVNRALTWLLAAVHGLVVRVSRGVVTVAGVKVFAHRGASTQYAEHTRAAFSHALAVGADGVETDVQITADGVLVCWHDSTVNRTSNGQGAVQAH